jgi:apolipoprotein N-acyltransferase
MTPLIYILSSAAIYAASFLFIFYFWWGAFFFLVPLFYLLRTKHLTFFHGFVWGIVTYGFHLSAVGAVSVEYGKGLFRFIAPLIVLMWFALWSGLWFVGLSSVRNYSLHFKIVLQLFITSVFFFFIHYIVLFPFFCQVQGYPFVLPLIPLMYGNLLGWLPFVGSGVMLAILIGFQLTVAYQYKFSALALLVVFLSGIIFQKKQTWQQQFQTINYAWKHKEAYERAQEICHALIKAQEKHPHKRVLVLPESSFPFPLQEHLYALKMWTTNALFDDKYLILGSYRRETGKLFNTFYIVYQGRIILYYDKRHLIPFFETPHYFKRIFEKGNTLFLHKKESFTRGLTSPKNFSITSIANLTPLICSETFWTMPYQKRTISLVNDSYFSLAYFPIVMWVLAQLNALENESDLLYCSYRSNFIKEI